MAKDFISEVVEVGVEVMRHQEGKWLVMIRECNVILFRVGIV